nr:transposase (putative), gypsy type [Tanacetum cinerariifolium]
MSSIRTPQQNGVVERRNQTLVEAARTIKLDISFLHVFGALCYPKNDREDIGKLGAKGDIGFFIRYSANSCAYKIYNQRTKKIMETMNVTFDELSAMAFEQRELDLLFKAMYDGYYSGQPLAALRTDQAAQANPNVEEHNATNDMFDGNTFVNPFATPSTSATASSSSPYAAGLHGDMVPRILAHCHTKDAYYYPSVRRDRRAILDAMAWRHHDSDINDLVPEDGFSMQDMEALTERVIDLRPVPSGLLFQGGLATTWDYPGFHLIFKDTEGNGLLLLPRIVFCNILLVPFRRAKTSPRRQITKEGSKWKILKSLPPGREKQGSRLRKGRERSKVVTMGRVPVESRENHSPPASPRDLANRPVHNYSDDHRDEEADDLNLGSFGEQSGRALTVVNTEVIQPSLACQRANRGPIADRVVTPLRTATQGANVVEGESSRKGALYVPGWSIHSLERAWFSLARGSIAQTDILERFENLQTDFEKLAVSHAEFGDLSGKHVQARLDLTHNTHLYTSLSDRHKALKNEHEGCAGKLEGLENRNRELSLANMDQVLQIKESEAELAQKHSALIYVERINSEHAQERKDWFTAIQAGWGKGIAEERFEEDLLELMGRMEGFDVHADTRMRVEYDKLFERRYPYVEKISHGFRHSVSDLLKVYPDSPPREQVLPHNPSSKKAPATSAPLGS